MYCLVTYIQRFAIVADYKNLSRNLAVLKLRQEFQKDYCLKGLTQSPAIQSKVGTLGSALL